ncbi:hypothetical protein H7K45_06725 [Mycobacterium yunnanensis]|uniref:Uncharacterized protein n=1 Tax=Mycobacterium yunnanensis TaxID=368477 RepID=A0A9X2Z122_9MYCO|nr:hypothetical protein [Mycobacterium yunnanensis]MCV7420227.1 hypothetical protein [Mycobacterium yunnanensis]
METFIRYVKIQLFVFLCGIVGPIFLIVFFAVQPEPDTKWLYWAGLFVTTGDILIALALTHAPVDDVAVPGFSQRRRGRG